MRTITIFRTSTIPLSLNVLLNGQLEFLSQNFEVVAVSGAGADLNLVAEREGVKTIPIEMERNISPLKDLRALFLLYRLFRKEKPHIVHSITPKAGLLSMTAAKMAGVPVRIHTFTGLIFPSKTGFLQQLLIWMDRLLCASATHIYPEGNGVRNDLIRYRITRKPLKIIANGNVNGIDTEYFNPEAVSEQEKSAIRSKYGIQQEDFVFVFVGRLVKDKGINELVAAFKTLQNSQSHHPVTSSPHYPITTSASRLKLLLVGPLEQELDPLLPETLEEIKNNPDIISVGFQEDVRPYFAIAHALAFPSYREGFPNVVMQAGAMGLPSIVTDINGCNEIIQNGINGLIIPPKNVEELRRAMRQLMQDHGLWNTMCGNARPLIESRYRQELVWNALKQEYDQLLAGKNGVLQ